MQDFHIYGFDERLKNLRAKHGFTQQYVADKIGVSKSTINRYENDNMPPSLDSAVKIAILFNVSVDYLIGLGKESYLYLFEFTDKQKEYVLRVVQGLQDVISDEANRPTD